MATPGKPYQQGSWFAVPIEDGAAYVLGLVARCNRSVNVFAYFFDHVFEGQPPTLDDAQDLTASDAAWIMHTGGQAMIERRWPVVGTLPGWDPDDWPVPVLRARSKDEAVFRRMTFVDGPFKHPQVDEITFEEWDQMPDYSGHAKWERGSSYGWKILETTLERRVRGISEPGLLGDRSN